MKKYNDPQIEIVYMQSNDVIASSKLVASGTYSGFGADDEAGWIWDGN